MIMAEKIIVEVDEDIADLIPDYLDNQRVKVKRLEEFLSRKDYNEIAQFAHRIRGSGASYGFEFLTEVGAVIEDAAENSDVKIIRESIEKLTVFLERVEVKFVSEEDF